MRTIQTKEEFIKNMELRMKINDEILEYYNNVFLPTLKKFDGKVYNIRFIKALRSPVEDNRLFYISELQYGEQIEIRVRLDEYNYNDYQSLYVSLKLINGRIDYDITINNDLGKKWFENFSQENAIYQSCIDNYDEYLSFGEKMEKVVSEWNEIPFPFRRSIDTSWLRIY